MARLAWDAPGSRFYETGIDRGVLYLQDKPGVPWSGLTSVDVSPSGGGVKSYYLDGEKYLIISAREEFGGTLNALTYPPEFGQCDGSAQVRSGLFLQNQRRKTFGLSYRTMIGSDQSPEHGYKIHIVYNAVAEPTQRNYGTRGDNEDPTEFSWNLTTRPPRIEGYQSTSHVIIDSRTTDKNVLGLVENALYGDEEGMAYLPAFDELVSMFDAYFVFVVTDNGDHTYTISGPDDAILEEDDIFLKFDWPTVIPVDENTYTISSG